MKKTSRYEDWFEQSEFSPLELALLMADTAPDWPLGKDILELAEGGNPINYEKFCGRYQDKEQLWSFYEKFKRAKQLVLKSMAIGALANNRQTKAGRISYEAAIKFVYAVAENPNAAGDTYSVFTNAADERMLLKATSIQKKGTKVRSKRPRWWHLDYDLVDMAVTKASYCRDKEMNLNQYGAPSLSHIAREIEEYIAGAEARKGTKRKIGAEAIRKYLEQFDF